MRLKRLFCGVCAAALAAMNCAVPAFAEEEEVVVDPWSISDDSILTDDKSKPTFSFDGDGWKDYVHVTPDAEALGYKAATEDTVSYQGYSLKVTGSQAGAPSGMHNFAWTATDADGKLVYPGSDAEDASFITCGIELDAADFGMNYFDGCTFKFTYRINPDIKGKLMSDSIFAFPADDEYTQLTGTASAMMQIKVNETDAPNTKQYQDKVIPVPMGVGATKFIFEIPLDKATSQGDLIYIDNLTISANEAYSGKIVANIDGYNESAEKKASPNELQIKEKEESTASDSSTAEEKESSSALPIIIGVVAGIAVVGGLTFFIIKKARNRYL